MTSDFHDYAVARREASDLIEAGDYYTASMYEELSKFQMLPSDIPGDADTLVDPGRIGMGTRELLLSALCYRLAGSTERARLRCRKGLLIVDDVAAYEEMFGDPARQGWCHEARGDLKLFGDLDDPEEEYESARNYYEGVENDIGWLGEDEFEFLIQPLLAFAESIGYEVPEREIRRTSLTDRISFKNLEYPEIIHRVIDEGGWEASRFV